MWMWYACKEGAEETENESFSSEKCLWQQSWRNDSVTPGTTWELGGMMGDCVRNQGKAVHRKGGSSVRIRCHTGEAAKNHNCCGTTCCAVGNFIGNNKWIQQWFWKLKSPLYIYIFFFSLCPYCKLPFPSIFICIWHKTSISVLFRFISNPHITYFE